ncbi:PH domain-containing protein [Luteibacter sp. CQ10]|uniref:PH domain-containing protein n=1 Tax=Luteibacter sp. CQ10 TaxID=2805821 RepID=UPI0034A5D07A
MQTFSTGMSNITRWTGMLALLVCVVAIVVMAGRVTDTVAVPLAGLLLVILSITFALSPLRYEIHGHELVVRRQVGRTTADLRGASVSRDGEAFRGLVRVFGNGGFFAFHGVFYSRRLGFVRVYARNRDHGVVVTLRNGKTWVLSPDEPDRMVAALRVAAAS